MLHVLKLQFEIGIFLAFICFIVLAKYKIILKTDKKTDKTKSVGL